MTLYAQCAERDHIFISYRRDDARGTSGRLYDWLRIGFGRERVFRDVQSIGVGKWRNKIDAALARSSVCVVVIGPRWANADNVPRLHDANDMVRHEIVTALASEELTLVPTLVEGAEVPKAAVLPIAVQPLFAVWNARRVTEDGWEDDTRRLITEIADASRLQVDPNLDRWLSDARAAHARVAEREQGLQSDQIDALRRSVDELTRRLAEASAAERPARAAAFAALAQGDSLAAEDLFEREYDAQSRAAGEAQQQMAEAARNVANLALLRDIAKAASFYRKALAIDPEHAETARLLGHALILIGDLTGAQGAFSRSLTAAVAQSDEWGEYAARIGLGDVLVAQGDGPGALAAYRRGLAIAEALAARDPDNTQWQRDLSVSHNKIGDVLVAQGDGPGALAAYRRGLAIAEALAARDPANTEWQRDLSVSHDRIGDVLVAQGDGPGALAAYRRAWPSGRRWPRATRPTPGWQRDLSVSHNKIGDVLVAQGDWRRRWPPIGRAWPSPRRWPARDPANTELAARPLGERRPRSATC